MRRSLAAVVVALITATGAYADLPEGRPDAEYAMPREGRGEIHVTEWTPKTIPGTSCVSTQSASGGISTVCFPTPPARRPIDPETVFTPDCVPDAIMIAPPHYVYFGRNFSEFDADTDARISEDEFVAVALPAWTREEDSETTRLREVRRLFVELDEDADGYVLREDWYEARTCQDEDAR